MVIVISSPNCQGCRFTKKRLHERGIEFEERNVAEDPAALDLAKSLGYASAPVVIVGEEHWSGFNPGRLDAIQG